MISRLAGALALGGGAVLLATAALTTFSVLRRWLTSQPVRGDFELISLGGGIAVAGFLALGTLRGANILVDTFTGWLPARATRVMDLFWAVVWAVVAGLIAWRLGVGAFETRASGTTTLVLGLPTWWAALLCAAGFGATALAALAMPRAR